ncbi:MAG: hypothetical protein P8N02_05020 [Actinomycetota bacterium]|jgi:hypothetical protein|nr:hypothetical protein [Actinomycetota bacterium]
MFPLLGPRTGGAVPFDSVEEPSHGQPAGLEITGPMSIPPGQVPPDLYDQLEHTPPWADMSPADFEAWTAGSSSGESLYFCGEPTTG